MFALDITENRIRILELAKKGRALALHGLGEKEFQTQQQLPSLLQKLVKNTRPFPITSRDIALAIPEEETFIKIVQTPGNSQKETKAFLEQEIDKILPFDRDEVYWDWKAAAVLGQASTVDVMIVASPKSFIDPYLHLIKDAGFYPSLIDCESNALLWGIRNPFGSQPTNEPTLVMNIGNKKTTIAVWAQGLIRFSSSVRVGMAGGQADYLAADWGQWVKTNKQEWAATEKSLTSLTKKLREYINYYNEQANHSAKEEKITKVVVSGAWANFPELRDFFAKKLGMMVVKPEMIIPVHPAYTTALGLALRGIYEEYYA